MDSFRAAIRSSDDPKGLQEISIDNMIAIVNALFIQYEYSEQGSVIPASQLRYKLSQIDSAKYPLGSFADATEALYSILSQIHADSCRSRLHQGQIVSENDECTPKCLAHCIFGGVFVEQFSCTACGATSEPIVMNRLLHYIYADEVVGLVSTAPVRPDYGSILSYCLRPVAHACPSNTDRQECKGEGRASLSCLEPSRVLAFCVSWADDTINQQKLSYFVDSIGINISVADVFPYGNMTEDRFNGCATHTLSGLVCFYGKHYICFCKYAMILSCVTYNKYCLYLAVRDDVSVPTFMLFDDSRVR